MCSTLLTKKYLCVLDSSLVDPLSSSDGQSHTPSSGSFHTSSSSSFSGSGGGGRLPHSDIKSRLRPELPERRSMRLMANDEKLLDSYFSAFSDDDEGDDEYVPVEDWKQVCVALLLALAARCIAHAQILRAFCA